LLDCGKVPMPIHVVSPFADAKERALKERAVAIGGEPMWVWHADKEMPPLPERSRLRGGATVEKPWSASDVLSAAGE
jgi:hypothetical protein